MDKKRWVILILGFVVLGLLYIGAPRTHAATSTITGTIQDAQGNPVNGTITFQLPIPAVDTATNTAIAPNVESYRIINGVIQAGPPLFDVAGLSPKNLFYAARVYDTAGNLILYGNYVVTGGSFNFGAAVPTTVTTSNISYVMPVVTSVPNTFTATQAFSTIASSSSPVATAGFIRRAFVDQDCWQNSSATVNLCIGVVQTGANQNFINVNGVTLGGNSIVAATTNNPLSLTAGPSNASAGASVGVQGSSALGVVNGGGGNVTLTSGGGLGNGNSGDVIVTPGTPGVTGSSGNLVLTGRVFANLGTPPSGNGSITFCLDCTVANPCAGGGTGALAKRLNGAWVCN